MSVPNYITSFCTIRSSVVTINSMIDFTSDEPDAALFFKAVYKHYQLVYPKFHKMDKLCKLAFLASELLPRTNNLAAGYNKEDIAIIIANSASSLQTDTEHQQTIDDKDNYYPSPSVFVYTLPNILIGEIAIRNGIMGENTFFIFDKFDAAFMSRYVNSLLNTGRAQCCISGWVDFYEGNYEAFLYTVEKKAGALNLEHTAENLEHLK